MILALILALALQAPLTPPALKKADPLSPRIEAARQRMLAGDTRGAVADLKAVLAADGRSVDALYWIGIAYLDLGRIEEAKDSLTGALEASAGSHSDALYHLGLIELQAGNSMEACLLLERAIAKSTAGFPAAEGALAAAYVSAANYDRAILLLDRIVAVRPEDATSQHLLGLALEQRFIHGGDSADVDRALRAHQEAVALRPDYSIAHRDFGLTLLWFGRAGEAATHLERFVLLQPTHPSAATFKRLVERLRSGLAQEPSSSTATVSPYIASGPAAGARVYSPAAPGSSRGDGPAVDGIVLSDGTFFSLGVIRADSQSSRIEQDVEGSKLTPGRRAGRPASLRVLIGR